MNIKELLITIGTFFLFGCGGGGSSGFSESTTEIKALNDTGIDWCSSSDKNYFVSGSAEQKQQGCIAVSSSHPGQDATSGRDALFIHENLEKIGSGILGFDFTKICNSGSASGSGSCPIDPRIGIGNNEWGCTRDNATGLIWENKLNDESHFRHYANTFSWYSSSEKFNGGGVGTEGGGVCTEIKCDTQNYIKQLNSVGLCGFNDWAIPSERQLHSIVSYGVAPPAVDVNYFPNTSESWYWSSVASSRYSGAAKVVSFSRGYISEGDKSGSHMIRAVRNNN